jgi:CheY-like chemotaxis protein
MPMKAVKPGPIVIVEDDPDDQEMINELITELVNNPIIFFSNGEDAFDYLQTTKDTPFIIISDINMPIMNGLELREAINATEFLRRKSIPFVFLTTAGDKKTIEKAYDEHVQGFFVKPHDIKTFKKTLQLMLDYWDKCVHVNSVRLNIN